MKRESVRLSCRAIGMLALVVFLTIAANAATCTWTGTVSTDWHLAVNWSGCGVGEPQAADDVIINNVANAPTLTLPRTIHSLTNNGETVTLNADLIMNGTPGTATLSNGGTITGTGSLVMQNTVTISNAGTLNASLRVAGGTTTVFNSTIGGSITIDSGATLTVGTDHIVTHTGNLTNNGTLAAGPGGSGTALHFSGSGTTVTNNGTISILHFRFIGFSKNVAGTGTWTGSTVDIRNGATVTLTSNVAFAPGGFTVNPVGGGTLNLNGFIFTFSGGGFTNGGTVSGAGTFRTQGTPNLSIPFSGFTSAMQIASGNTTVFSSTIAGSVTIDSGATLTVSTDNVVTHTGNLTNNGTLAPGPGGSGTAFHFSGTTITNNGTISILNFRFTGGMPNLAGTGTWTGSTVDIRNGATVTLTSNVNFAPTNFTVNAVGGGTLNLNGFIFTFSGGGFTNGGTVSGAGTFRTQGTPNLSIPFSGFTSAMQIASGNTTVFSSTIAGSVTIDSGATLTVATDNVVNHTGDLTNNGTLSGTGGSGTAFHFNGTGTTLTNNGTISVLRFRFNAAGAKNLAGTGTWTGATVEINSGATVTLTSNVNFAPTNFTVNAVGGGTLNLGGLILTLNGVNFTNGGTVTGTGTFKTQGATTLNISGLTFAGALLVDSGTTTIFNSTIQGSITINAGATLTVSTDNIVTHTGNLTNNGTLAPGPGGSGTAFHFNGTGTTLTNNGTISVLRFRFNTAGAKNLAGTGTWTGATVEINSGATVTLTSNVSFAPTNFTVNADFNGGTLDLGGFILTLNGVNFTNNNGTVTGTGTFRTQGATTLNISGLNFAGALLIDSGTTNITNSTIQGSITINPSATLNVTTDNLVTHTGNLTNNGTLTGTGGSGTAFHFSGNGTSVINNGLITVLFFRFNATGAKNLGGTGSFSGSNVVHVNSTANVTLTSSHQLRFLTVNADNNGGTFNLASHTLKLSGAGTPLVVNVGTFNSGTGTVEYNGTAAQTVATANINYFGLSINNVAGVSLSAAETIPGGGGLLSLRNGAFNIGSNLTMANFAAIDRYTGSLTGTPNFGANVIVSYVSSGNITAGSEIPASPSVLLNLSTVGGPPFTVTLPFNATVNNLLTLNGGSFNTGVNTLTLGPNAGRSRIAGHIIGNERKIFNGVGSFLFDVGTGGY